MTNQILIYNSGMNYDRQHPFLASIKERYQLCQPGSSKDTRHVILDIEGSGISYNVGDSIGVSPLNEPALVSRMLSALGATGEERVIDKKGESHTFFDYLHSHANLKGVTRKMVSSLVARLPLAPRAFLEDLLKEENKEALKGWMHAHELWDLLEHFPDVQFTPQEVADFVMPLLPRFYSIASSQTCVGSEVHLMVAYLRYETRGIPRLGVCTHYLCHLAPMHQPVVPIYVQPGHGFRLPPEKDRSIIMIGPGTGVAPFRAFMQERTIHGHSGKNWLFFGEWTRTKEFFYENEWNFWRTSGLLRLDTAFSRDQNHKIYVQHKMMEQGEELYRWLEEGAILYVCGDAHHMAKDVDQALHLIIQKHGHKTEEAANQYIKHLKAEKRYLRDVY